MTGMATTTASPHAAGIMATPRPASTYRMPRRLLIVLSVIALHVAAVWALQAGLLRRAVEVVIPVEVLAELIEPPPPPAPPPPQPQPPVPPRPKAPPQPKPKRQPVTAPRPEPPPPVAIDPTPADNAPLAPPGPAEPVEAVAPPSPPTPPAPAAPTVELPSTAADYLRNPPPVYPSLSRRLGEQGRVTLRVLVEADGTPSQVQVAQSSGYERLDKAAV